MVLLGEVIHMKNMSNRSILLYICEFTIVYIVGRCLSYLVDFLVDSILSGIPRLWIDLVFLALLLFAVFKVHLALRAWLKKKGWLDNNLK